ncbi:MAG TPA: transglutaminase-like domain-containing protein, partial [Gemmataceae bacterium]
AKEALAETTTYPLSHPRVRELAREAVGDAKTDREKVERLVKFVNGYITPSYTAEPLNLLKLIREKQGDCSEYALLFAALARAAGVPCREVGGLVYMGDAEKAFGPHAWNEVVLDGKWVPVDASVPQAEIDPTHVRYGSAAGDGMLNLAASFAGMSFRVVEVKRRGE